MQSRFESLLPSYPLFPDNFLAYWAPPWDNKRAKQFELGWENYQRIRLFLENMPLDRSKRIAEHVLNLPEAICFLSLSLFSPNEQNMPSRLENLYYDPIGQDK